MRMQTISSGRAEVRAIVIDASPDAVVALLRDGHRLPDWAPSFAQRAEPDGDVWCVNGEQRMAIRVAAQARTVDFVSPVAPVGLFTRTIPIPRGCACVFTMYFGDGTETAAIEEQLAVMEQELETVRRLVEHASG
jgi:hypothetical protein